MLYAMLIRCHSTVTFLFPCIMNRRKFISSLIVAKTPSAWIERLMRNKIPSSVDIFFSMDASGRLKFSVIYYLYMRNPERKFRAIFLWRYSIWLKTWLSVRIADRKSRWHSARISRGVPYVNTALRNELSLFALLRSRAEGNRWSSGAAPQRKKNAFGNHLLPRSEMCFPKKS